MRKRGDSEAGQSRRRGKNTAFTSMVKIAAGDMRRGIAKVGSRAQPYFGLMAMKQ